MSAEQLLEFAEERGFLDDRTVAKLRAQVAAAGRPVSAQRIAKLLVKKGLLTRFQAKSLLEAIAGPTTPTTESETTDDEQELLALDDDPAVTLSELSVDGDEPTDDSDELTPVDSDAELTPVDSSAELQPIDSSPELQPVDSSVDLQPVDSSAELQPLDSSLDLQPLDSSPELQPLDSSLELTSPAESAKAQTESELAELAPLEEAPELVAVDDAATAVGAAEFHADDVESTPSGQAAESAPVAADVADLGDDAIAAGAALQPARKRKSILTSWLPSGGKRAPRRKRGNRWDSPLMLLGGGGLVLLIIAGLFLYFILNRETGDEIFSLAEEAYRSQSYPTAIKQYQNFLNRFPDHPSASTARVKQGMARLRQTVDQGGNWQRALDTANEQLPLVKGEPAFDDSRPELAGLLTNIYAGFVENAKEATSMDQKQELLQHADEALQLVDNSEYLPTSVRTQQQPRIESIGDDVVLILREINRDKELAQAVEKITAAAQNQQTAEAYAIRRELLARYPGLLKNPQLQGAVQGITRAELAKVTVSQDAMNALAEDHAVSVPRRVVVSDRQTKQSTGLVDQTVAVLARGAVYGIDANDGRVLWRRWVGHETLIPPQTLSDQPGADVLLIDSRRQELLRVGSKTGKLVWRLPLGESRAAPLVLENRIFLSTVEGRVLSVDAESGQASPTAQLPQTNLAPLGVDAGKRQLFVPGQHSSLYVMSADSMDCQDVVYVGHKPDSIAVAPASVAGFVVVAENGGSDYALLHVLRRGDDGTSLVRPIEPIRLDGQIVVPLVVFRRRMLAATDRGGLFVFEFDPANAETPVRMVAKTLPSVGGAMVHYPVVNSGQVFVAGDRLTRYELQATREELARKWIGNEGDTYVAQPFLFRDVMIHVRRRKGSAATTVSAVRVSLGRSTENEGQELWSTDLAAPPAMAAKPDQKRRSIVTVSSTGALWDINSTAMRSGLLDTTSDRALRTGGRAPLSIEIPLTAGRSVLTTHPPTSRVLRYDPSAGQRLREIALKLPSDNLACDLVSVSDQLVACTTDGPIYLLNALNAAEAVFPFQPTLSADQKVRWLRPAVVDADKLVFAVAEAGGTVHLIGVESMPKPHLAAIATSQVDGELVAGVAAIGDVVLLVALGSDQDDLLPMQLPSLNAGDKIPLAGRVAWGPHRVGDLILVATDTDQLYAVDAGAALAWTSPLTHGPLAGPPLPHEDQLICASVQGKVWQLSATTGESVPWGNTAGDESSEFLDLHEALSGGPVAYAKSLLLLGRDSTLYITELPRAKPPVAEVGRLP